MLNAYKEGDINIIELDGVDEIDFVNDQMTKIFSLGDEAQKVFRIALEDDSVIAVAQTEPTKYKNKLIILKDRKLKFFYV